MGTGIYRTGKDSVAHDTLGEKVWDHEKVVVWKTVGQQRL